jgi:hypothetical protein
LKRFSITYPAAGRESVYIAENQSATVLGKMYTGPLLVTTKWQPKALGLVLFAADDRATARAASNHKEKENETMDPKLRKFLERSGLAATATEAEAWDFMETLKVQRAESAPSPAAAQATPTPAAAAPADNGDVARSEELVVRKERDRITEITALCGRFGLDEMAGRAIADGKTVVQVQAEVLAAMAERKDPGYRPAQVITDERDKFRSAAEDGLMIRSGISPEKPAAGARDMAGWSLLEVARHALIVANQPSGGNKLEMVGRALTTTDFPYLLANVANKSLFAGWDGAQETWSQWCATGSVSDFKTQYLPRLSETEDLDEMPEGMEYKFGKRAEAQESFSIATYGKMLAITRQTIINDDLMSMTDIPKAHGEAAARKVGDLPYAVLTANAAMGDGNALFSTAHANYVAGGSGAIPGVATIAAGILAMGIQKDLLAKRRLNIRPVFFLAPKALEGAAEVFFRTDRFSDANTVATDSSFASTRVNPYSGTVLTRVYDARLDDDDVAAWYLAASKGRTVTVYFLDGQQKPYMETRQGWNVDGVEYKVRIDAGAKAVDWKGLYYNDGN